MAGALGDLSELLMCGASVPMLAEDVIKERLQVEGQVKVGM